LGDERFAFIFGEFACGGFAAELSLNVLAFLLDLGDPGGGDDDVAVVFEERPVLGEFDVAFFEQATQFEDATLVVVVEEATDPGIESRHDGILTHVDGLGVLLLGHGVFGGDLASVVGPSVVPGSLHSALTDSAADQP